MNFDKNHPIEGEVVGAPKRSWREAIGLYIHDRDKNQMARLMRTVGLVMTGAAPPLAAFAAVNDVFAPVTMGATLLDDPPAIVFVVVGLKVAAEINRYRSPHYRSSGPRTQ